MSSIDGVGDYGGLKLMSGMFGGQRNLCLSLGDF